MSSDKKSLRRGLIERRKSIPANEKQRLDEEIFERVINMPEYLAAREILSYVSTEIEVDTRKIIKHALTLQKAVYVPISGDTELYFRRIYSLSELHTGRYGILEPDLDAESPTITESTVCLVPALSFNRENYRLGYGKGYYDRFLSGFDGVSTGLCYESFIGEIPISEFDIPVDILVTDRRSYGKERIQRF